MTKDHVVQQDNPARYDLSRCVGTKKPSMVLHPGDLLSGSHPASKRDTGWWLIQADRGGCREAAQTRSGSGQMVLRSTIPSSN